ELGHTKIATKARRAAEATGAGVAFTFSDGPIKGQKWRNTRNESAKRESTRSNVRMRWPRGGKRSSRIEWSLTTGPVHSKCHELPTDSGRPGPDCATASGR